MAETNDKTKSVEDTLSSAISQLEEEAALKKVSPRRGSEEVEAAGCGATPRCQTLHTHTGPAAQREDRHRQI